MRDEHPGAGSEVGLRRHLIRKLRDDRGQALVELAFVIPLLLLFLFGIIDFGLALNQANTNTDIANVAAREAAVVTTSSVTCATGGTTVTETTLASWAQCETGTSAGTTICVYDVATSPTGTSYKLGDPLKVTVSNTFQWASVLTSKDSYIGKVMSSASSTLSSSATMIREQGTSAAAAVPFLTNPSGC